MINNEAELDRAIEQLEQRRRLQERELIDQFQLTKESLKPANIIKSSLGKLGSSDFVGPVLKTAGTIGMGLLTNKFMGGPAASGGKGLVKTILKQSAAKTVIRNFDAIKAYGLSIYKNVFGNKEKNKE